jgi:hypothetical protein
LFLDEMLRAKLGLDLGDVEVGIGEFAHDRLVLVLGQQFLGYPLDFVGRRPDGFLIVGPCSVRRLLRTGWRSRIIEQSARDGVQGGKAAFDRHPNLRVFREEASGQSPIDQDERGPRQQVLDLNHLADRCIREHDDVSLRYLEV